MDKALLDTDILSDILKKKDRAVSGRAREYRAHYGKFTLSAATVMEVVSGLCRLGAHRQLDIFLSSLDDAEVLPIDDNIAILAGTMIKLEGLGDVDDSIEAGGFVSYRKKPYSFKLEARQDINSGHEGALVELSAGRALPFKKPRVSVALGTTWASDDYMESFFGISSKQSAKSGLKRYNADAGIKDISLSVTAGYRISSNCDWRLGGKVEYKRLVGDAADSPIVEDKNQFLAGIGITYHFGSKVVPEDNEIQ